MTAEDQSLDDIRNELAEAKDLIRKGDVGAANVLLDNLISKTYRLLAPPEILQQALSAREHIEKRSRLRANRIWLLLVLIVTGLVLSVLVNTKVRDIEIYAELQARRVEMYLADSLHIGGIDLEEIELNGMDTIETFAAYSWKPFNRELKTDSARQEGPRVVAEAHILLKPAAKNFNVVTSSKGMYLEKVKIEKQVLLTATADHENAWSLLIEAPSGKLSGELQVGDKVEVKCVGCALKDIPVNKFYLSLTPEEAIKFSGEGGSNITLGEKDNAKKIILASHFVINGLSFVDPDDEINPSTLIGGEIRFSSTSSDSVMLRAGDALVIDPTESIKVTQLEYGPNLTLRISGKANDLRRNMVSILPSWLEWIHQSNGIVLYLGGLSSLVSFVWLLMKRFELVRD